MYKNIDDLLNVILKTNFDSLNSVLEKYNGVDVDDVKKRIYEWKNNTVI